MPTAARQAHDRTLLGILFMCTASSLFPVMNGLVQVLSPRYPSEQIVWARVVSHLVFILVLFAPRFGLVPLVRTTQLKWQVLRSVVLLTSTFLLLQRRQAPRARQGRLHQLHGAVHGGAHRLAHAGRAHDAPAASLAVIAAFAGRAGRHPAGQRRVPLGLAADLRQLRLLRTLPGRDAPGRRPRPPRDLGRLQRAGRHAGHVGADAVRVVADPVMGRRRPAVLARHPGRARALFRRPGHDLRARPTSSPRSAIGR